jgi:hypothetical protein
MTQHHLDQLHALERRILHLEKSKRVRTTVTLGLVGATLVEKMFPHNPVATLLGLVVNTYWVWGM